jgi:hypothetical protein
MSVDQVNAGLEAANDDVMTLFAYQEGGALAAGRVLPWRLATGGSGEYVHLELPVSQGTLSGVGSSAALDGLTLRLLVPLKLVSTGPQQSDLRPDLHTLADGTPIEDIVASGGAFTIDVPGVIDPTNRLSADQQRAFAKLLAAGLAGRAQELDYAFARLGGAAGIAGFPAPVNAAFSYADVDDPPASYLVILATIDGRDTSGLDAQFEPELLDGHPAAVVAISGDVVLRQLLMPGLPAAIGHGTGAGSFRWDAGTEAVVSTGTIHLDSCKSGLITYYPQVDSLSIRIYGNQVQTVANGSCDLYLGLGLKFQLTVTHQLAWNGTAGAARFQQVGNPSISHQVTGGGGSLLPIAWLLSLIVDAIVTAIVTGISNAIAGNLGGMRLGDLAPVPIHWSTGAAGLKVGDVRLDDALMIRGLAS